MAYIYSFVTILVIMIETECNIIQDKKKILKDLQSPDKALVDNKIAWFPARSKSRFRLVIEFYFGNEGGWANSVEFFLHPPLTLPLSLSLLSGSTFFANGYFF